MAEKKKKEKKTTNKDPFLCRRSRSSPPCVRQWGTVHRERRRGGALQRTRPRGSRRWSGEASSRVTAVGSGPVVVVVGGGGGGEG